MGAAYKPNRRYGDFGKNGPIYRRGTFITRAFFRGGGITIGRDLVVNRYNENKMYQDEKGYILNTAKLNQNIEAHETGHYVQQQELGFANFYGKIFTEYLNYLVGQ